MCQYNQRKALKKGPPVPTDTITFALMMAVKPIYKDLSEPSVLRQCLHGMTQIKMSHATT